MTSLKVFSFVYRHSPTSYQLLLIVGRKVSVPVKTIFQYTVFAPFADKQYQMSIPIGSVYVAYLSNNQQLLKWGKLDLNERPAVYKTMKQIALLRQTRSVYALQQGSLLNLILQIYLKFRKLLLKPFFDFHSNCF